MNLNIQLEHPEYTARKAMRRKYRDLYVGGEQLKERAVEYLIRRQKEAGDVYGERLQRVFYENYVGSIIDWYASHGIPPGAESDVRSGCAHRQILRAVHGRLRPERQHAGHVLPAPTDGGSGAGRKLHAGRFSADGRPTRKRGPKRRRWGALGHTWWNTVPRISVTGSATSGDSSNGWSCGSHICGRATTTTTG